MLQETVLESDYTKTSASENDTSLKTPWRNSLVSVIIPALVLTDDLFYQARKAVESLRTSDIELIIVDNGSTVGAEWLKEKADIYLHYPNQIGFGRACNQGLKLATSDYLMIASIDNEYLSGTVEEMCELYKLNEPGIGVISPSMVNKGQAQVDQLFTDQTEGSTFLFSRKVYDLVKLPEVLYDERFEHGYYEDMDLWQRLRNLNLSLVRTGHILANHHQGTTNKHLGVLEKYMEINKKKYIEKWGELSKWTG